MVVRQDDVVVLGREGVERLEDAREDGAAGHCGRARRRGQCASESSEVGDEGDAQLPSPPSVESVKRLYSWKLRARASSQGRRGGGRRWRERHALGQVARSCERVLAARLVQLGDERSVVDRVDVHLRGASEAREGEEGKSVLEDAAQLVRLAQPERPRSGDARSPRRCRSSPSTRCARRRARSTR